MTLRLSPRFCGRGSASVWRLRSVGGEQAALDQKFSVLKDWVQRGGGYVHDALRLHAYEKPPYQTLRVSYDIPAEEITAPCIRLPPSVVLDRRRALDDLEDVLSRKGCPPLYARHTIEILAVFIAYHREQGAASLWYPAIASLSETPPCPWLKQIRDLREIQFDEELQAEVQKERNGNDLIAEQLHLLYGQFLNISKLELLWAYAQAQAVSFHQLEGSFWAPLAHYVRHDRDEPPLYRLENGDRVVPWGWMNRPVSAGEHLKMNMGIESSLLLYLSRGIVTENL